MGDEIDLALRLGRLNLRVSTSDPLGFPSGQPAAPNSPVGSEGSFVLVRSSSEPEAASEEPPAAAGPSALTLTLSFRDPNSASTPLGEGLNRSSASEPLAGPPAPCSSRAAHSRVARPRVIIGSCAPAPPEPAAHRPDREPSDPSQASRPRAGPEPLCSRNFGQNRPCTSWTLGAICQVTAGPAFRAPGELVVGLERF